MFIKSVDILLHYIQCSLLAEGTGKTWWILLHNARKSRHRRIKKQRRYERLLYDTSQLLLWVVGGFRQAPGGWVLERTLYVPGWGGYSSVTL